MRCKTLSIAGAVLALCVVAGSAQAAPTSSATGSAVAEIARSSGLVDEVHRRCRLKRVCWWHHGHLRCRWKWVCRRHHHHDHDNY
ncbi:MAG TPA: hypothetical protein VJ045_02440 [Hyphomicrobiaceae bacterium]|nr:hypothetical protein [Hyphomicrobiaceae bacterium]